MVNVPSDRFAFAILAANQVVAVSNIVKFRYDDGITCLNWSIGEEVDHAVWFSAFLVCVVIFNMFPVRVRIARVPRCLFITDTVLQVFGELEYVFGTIKMIFITMLILLLLVLDTMKRKPMFSR